jgi:hypothetical protein
MKEFHFSKGNRKITNNVLIWNLPAISTCPGSSTECRKFCYALKAERLYPSCLASREKNLAFSKREDFVEEIVAYLRKRKETIIRVHESGDFYCPSYFYKWCEIARQLPEKTFYAYTKSYFFNNFWDNVPSNFKLIQSVESRFPDKVDWSRSTARVILSPTERKPNEFICPEQLAKKKGRKIKCMEECKLCLRDNIHVCFLKH